MYHHLSSHLHLRQVIEGLVDSFVIEKYDIASMILATNKDMGMLGFTDN